MAFDDAIPIVLIIPAFLFLPFLIVRALKRPSTLSLARSGTIILLGAFIGAVVYFESSFQWPDFILRPPAFFVLGPS